MLFTNTKEEGPPLCSNSNLKHILSTLIFLALAFMPKAAQADCIIDSGETVNVSDGALNGCSGTVTILGTLVIDATLNLSLSSITTIIINEGTIQWTGNHDLILPPNLPVQIINGGSISASNACNANKRIIVGLEGGY